MCGYIVMVSGPREMKNRRRKGKEEVKEKSFFFLEWLQARGGHQVCNFQGNVYKLLGGK